jgi:hypothetical protein
VATRAARDRPHRIEVVGELDAHAAEAFMLEVARLARRWKRDIRELRVEVAPAPPARGSR